MGMGSAIIYHARFSAAFYSVVVLTFLELFIDDLEAAGGAW